MAGRLEYEIAQMGGETLEELLLHLLSEEGFDVHASGTRGTDGGWDAEVELDGTRGVAHASTASNWRRKLRTDASNVEDLADRRAVDYDLFVFVTNQEVTGRQELDLRAEIDADYGWQLLLYHERDLVQLLRTERPDLATDFLGVDPRAERDTTRTRDRLESILEAGVKAQHLHDLRGSEQYATIDADALKRLNQLETDLRVETCRFDGSETVRQRADELVAALEEAEPTLQMAADGGLIPLDPDFPDVESSGNKYQNALARVVNAGARMEEAAEAELSKPDT